MWRDKRWIEIGSQSRRYQDEMCATECLEVIDRAMDVKLKCHETAA